MPKPDARRPLVPHIVWIIATLLSALVGAQIYGRGAFFLVLGAAALLLAIGILWNSIQALTGDAPLSLEEALSMAAPSTEEERKASVLRALKDLDYERSVGKLSEEDYRDLTRKYRQEAKQLLLLVDESLGPARERAEALLEARLLEERRQAADEAEAKPADDMPSAGATAPESPPLAEQEANSPDTDVESDETKTVPEPRAVEREAK